MYKTHEIRAVHLEITSKCNAACPMCLRNISGGKVNPQLPLSELSIDDIQKIFPPEFIKQLNKIYYCGNYGDPVAAKDTLESLKYFKDNNPQIHLSIFSNASARPAAWWRDLAPLTKEVHFAIDGLADTNAIYRRGTQFDVIMRNAQAFIDAGGRAIWDYIVFRHNEHQIEEAKVLSEKMGFSKFNLKKTGRFFSNTRTEVKSQQAVYNAQGEFEYFLEMPLNPKYHNGALMKEEELAKKYGHLENYLDQTFVACKVEAEKSVYVSAEGFVFPCCWTANQLYPWYLEKGSSQVWQIIRSLPEQQNDISALRQPLSAIVEGEFFKKIENSWALPSTKLGKLKPCAKTCGREFDPFNEQFR